jgi:hypothetical protein
VSAADNFLHQNPSLQGQQLMQAVNAQPWDPSVKALTQFPSVLDNMSKNLSWTSALGEAYSAQAQDVMTAVQTLRAQAYVAGNLKSGSQITVVQQSPQTIVIQPTNPQVVYVPTYNPAVVYGTPYTTPGYSTGAVVATGLLAFGAGIAVGAAMSGGCCSWGYSAWNCNWHGGAVVYGGGAYYETRRGTVDITAQARALMARMAARTTARATTLRPGPMRGSIPPYRRGGWRVERCVANILIES